MAVVTFDKKTFEKEIGKIDEKMQHSISMFGTPVEHVDEAEIQVEVFPNRPDMLSYHGFKRGFTAYLGKNKGLKNYVSNKPEKNYTVNVDSSVKNIRPYTACAIIRGLEFDGGKIKEIIDVQEKLHATMGRKRKKVAIGIYPLDKISLPITFKAMAPKEIKFRPLDSEKEMTGLEILQKHPAGKEYSHLLKGKEKFPVFMDSENNILSMPPIINSETTGKINENTKDVFIECSGFEMNILEKCLNILSTTLSDMGGKICQMEVKYGSAKRILPDFKTEEMKISIENVNRFLGLELKEKEIKNFLERMGYEYKDKIVSIPSWRTDILHEVDLIEDIAIAYGYDNFIPEIPEISTIGEESSKENLKRKFSEILTGLGILEVSNYHLTTKEDQFKKMSLKEEGFIELKESKTEYGILRKNLSHYLLKVLSENIDVEYPQKIFEIGKVFEMGEKSEALERENLSLAVSPGNFTEARQILEYFTKSLGKEVKFKEAENFPEYFIQGRAVEIIYGSKTIGFLGEVHPRILKKWRIKMPVALLEISLEEIFDSLEKK